MAFINKQDTDGTKGSLLKGELGLDDTGSDNGRVYVGDGSNNVALAKKSEVDVKLDAADYTANDVLAKVKTVDGDSSGLDADLLDGNEADYFAEASTLSSHIGSGGSAHSAVTTSTAGFMSASDKTKLDGIEENATNYIEPSDVVHQADYATSTVGGTVKARLSGSTLYLTINGSDA